MCLCYTADSPIVQAATSLDSVIATRGENDSVQCTSFPVGKCDEKKQNKKGGFVDAASISTEATYRADRK